MENSAFKRGASAAGIWLRFTKTARTANSACVTWALRHHLPAFLGRAPVPVACFVILSVAIISGVFVGGAVILVSIFIYMLCNISFNSDHERENQNSTYGTEWRNGNEGAGIYTGSSRPGATSSRVDNYEDDED